MTKHDFIASWFIPTAHFIKPLANEAYKWCVKHKIKEHYKFYMGFYFLKESVDTCFHQACLITMRNTGMHCELLKDNSTGWIK